MLRYLLIELTKTRDALAAVAVSSAAMAQATISGTFNVDTQNTITNSDTTVGMGDAIVSVGVSEDLGGGLKASANTTLQTKAGRNGTVTNNGYSFALSGGFGAVSLSNFLAGNQETSAGISAASDMNHAVGGYFVRTRLNYKLPTLVDGLGIQLRWDENSNYTAAANAPKGAVTPDFDDTTKIYIDYSMGAAYIGYAATLKTLDDPGAIYLGYNFGFANVDLALTNYDHTEVAITAPLGANLSVGVQAMVGDYADAMGARLTYTLSKRTAVSFNFVDIKDASGAGGTNQAGGTDPAAQALGNNYRVRVSHKF